MDWLGDQLRRNTAAIELCSKSKAQFDLPPLGRALLPHFEAQAAFRMTLCGLENVKLIPLVPATRREVCEPPRTRCLTPCMSGAHRRQPCASASGI